MYELAGYPDLAARQLIRAARAAVRSAALDVAEQHLAAAHALTGTLPDAALEVLIERIDTLTLAGRAADGYHSGIAALQSLAAGTRQRLDCWLPQPEPPTALACGPRAAQLLARLEQVAEPTDPDLVVLRAHAALGGPEGQRPSSWANSQRRGRWTRAASRSRAKPCWSRAPPRRDATSILRHASCTKRWR